MPTTISIPLTNLRVGHDVTTPWQAVGSFTSYQFAINRNVGNTPLDTLSGDALVMAVDYSADGGVTVLETDSQTIAGGVILDRNGVEILVTKWGPPDIPVNAVQVRARVTPIQSCTVSGSLTLNP